MTHGLSRERLEEEKRQANVTPAMKAARDFLGPNADPNSAEYKGFMRDFYQLKGQGFTPHTIKRDGEDVTVFQDKQGNFRTMEEMFPGLGVARPQGESVIGPVPTGADPKTYRKEATEAYVKSQAQNKELREGGTRILGMVDQFGSKIRDPKTGEFSKQFADAVGPFTSEAHDLPSWDPRRMAYEVGQSREAKSFMDRVKSDAQAINSMMQRELLKGGGSVTENERTQINQILGRITAARSPQEAEALLTNFKGLVRQMFKMDTGDRQGEREQPASRADPLGIR